MKLLEKKEKSAKMIKRSVGMYLKYLNFKKYLTIQ